MEILKISFLFIAVWFTIVNATRLIYKQSIPLINMLIQAIGITGTIYLYFL